jgi:hypothetical protein
LVFADFSHKARAKSPGIAPVLRQPSVMLKLKNKQALGWLGDQDSNLNDLNCNPLKFIDLIPTATRRDKSKSADLLNSIERFICVEPFRDGLLLQRGRPRFME